MKRKISLVFLSLVLAFSTLFSLAFAITASAAAGTWELVTDASQIQAGDQIVIAAMNKDLALSTTQNSNNRGQATITKSGTSITFGEDTQIINVEAGTTAGTLAFKTDAGYLYAAGGTSKNYLRSSATLTATGCWNVSVTSDGIATIKTADSAVTRNTIQYNSSSSIFSCYASGQADVCIYKFVEAAAPEDPDCTHEGTEVTTNTVDATCQKAGKTTVTCECGYVISETEIPVLAHNYVDGACSECGALDPALGVLFDFGANGSAAHKDGADIGTGKEYTSGTYTLVLSNASKVYDGAFDAMGNSCLKLGTSSVTASFTFAVPEDVVKVIFSVAGYKNSAASVSINGVSYSVSKTSNSGEYQVIEVDTSSVKEITFETLTTPDERAMINSIMYVFAAAGDPECQHEKTEEVIVNPTCQAEGSKTINCADCGAFISTEPIAKLDSCAYGDDGICTMCGAPDPTNVGAILKALYALESGATLPGTYTLTGVITAIDTAYSAQFKNITVDIVVEGYEDMPVECYRLAGEGVDQIAVGDTITVTGSLTNYKNETYEFKQGCTLDSWVDNTTEPVLPTETNIAGVQAGEIGVTYKVVGATVVAVNAQSFLAKDESGYILVYLGSEWTADVKVGDVVTLEGASGEYAKSVQFAKGTTYTVTGSAEYQAPTAEVIDGAKIDEIAGAASITPDAYVTLSGTLNISGNYYNVVVDGTNVIVSITYPTADQAAALAALNGKKVEFTGYVTGYKNYLNLLSTSFEEIVPEVETKIAGTSLNVGNDLTFLYFVSLANGEDINRYSIKVEMNGKSYELSFSDMINGYYVFAFEGIAPQCMGDSIDAYLIKKGGEVVSSRTGYSVKAYLTDLVNDENNKDNSALLTLAADILAYGAAAQKYVDYNSDNLVNAGFPVAGSELDPAEATDRKVITKNDHENTYVSGLGVRFDYVNSIFVKVVAPSIEGVTLKINGQEVELVAYGNGYIGYSAGVSALKFDGDIQVELSLNGELVSIIEYSVNSYILTKYAGESVMAELATALYRYGASAVAYNNSLAN